MNEDQAPVLPANWSELAPLLDQLLDAPPLDRPALIAAMAGNNAARRAALERLLAESERGLTLLEGPAAETFTALQHEVGPLLPDVLGGRYRIEREVGRGGMARVYLALDVKHERRVAVKVIRPEIASSLARERFLREIGIAARLRHPNIMPLYDSGDVDDLLYFVMPYEQGKSLRARIDSDQKLGIAEGVSILRDVARALAAAHEQGVVHRDIKPDNVLLSGDAAVVTDFGIAKALTAAATEAGLTSATQAGAVIGTPAYMAPEQAIGDPATDHRADIYAFGCLAYEVFAGAPPFMGTTSHQIISAHLSEPPKPLASYRPDMPETVASLIARCLEKNPADRPASASELLDALGTMSAAKEQTVAKRSWSGPLMAIGLGLVVLLLGGWYTARKTAGGPVTVAVLPLEVTGDSEEATAKGFTVDLANALVRVPWLRVKSRVGASNYSGRSEIAGRTIGDSLGARYLLIGSLRKDGTGVSVTVQLIKSEDNAYVWGDKFFHPAHLEEVRDSIVRIVGDSLRHEAGRFANRFRIDTMLPQYAINDDAYTLYLQGKKKLAERGVRESIDLFRRAIRLDSNSANAWSGLSLALAISVISQNASVDSIRPEATTSANRALRLDRKLAEPHVAMAVVHSLDWKWTEAEREFQNALKLDAHEMESRIQYTRVLFAQGRIDDAHRQVDKALEDDPASGLALSYKGQAYLLQGFPDSAKPWSDRAMRVNPANPGSLSPIFRAMLLVRLNRRSEARLLTSPEINYEPYTLYVRGATGDSAFVRARLAELAAAGSRFPAGQTSQAYALLGLGDTTRALDALERATDRKEMWVNISPVELPVFDAVRESARFKSLRARAGLTAP